MHFNFINSIKRVSRITSILSNSVLFAHFILLTVTIDSPIQAHIYQLKKTDKGDSYKKKLSWLLRELKVVDGKDINKVCCDAVNNFKISFYQVVISSIYNLYDCSV